MVALYVVGFSGVFYCEVKPNGTTSICILRAYNEFSLLHRCELMALSL